MDYYLFIEHQDKHGAWHKSGLLLSSITEVNAAEDAASRAESLMSNGPRHARIFVMGDDSDGHPVAAIRKSRSGGFNG